MHSSPTKYSQPLFFYNRIWQQHCSVRCKYAEIKLLICRGGFSILFCLILSNRYLPNTESDQLRKIKQQIILAKKIPVSIILTCSCLAFTTSDWKWTLFLKLFPNCQLSYSLIPSEIFDPIKIPASGQNSEFLQLITCQCKWKQHS